MRPLVLPLVRPIARAIADAFGIFSPAYLYINGQQGAWYDPYDFSALFQDAAGTTPVTAVEQPVGRVLDKAGNGNHATQATAAARPVLSARKNTVLNSAFTGGGAVPTSWTQPIGTGTSTPAGAIDGSTIYRQIAVAQRPFFAGNVQTLGTVGSLTMSAYVETKHSGSLGVDQMVSWQNVPAGGVVTFAIDGVGVSGGTPVDTGQRVSATLTSGGTAGTPAPRVGVGCSGVVTADVSFSRPQVETGPTATRYQRVNTATDYDTAGFLHYDRFDGVDDSLTSTTGGGASTAAFLCIGFRQLTNGASNVLWSDRTGNTGLKLEVTAGGLIAFSGGNGAAIITATGGAVTLNTDYVVTALYDGVNLSVQPNNAAATTAACVLSAGTAGFTIGKDNGAASGFANVRTYQTIYVKNDMPTSQQITDTKRFVAGKSGVTL